MKTDLELRLRALANLVNVKTDDVEKKLLAELERVAQALAKSSDYDELASALKVLAVLGPRFNFRVLPILTEFVRSVPGRALTWDGEVISASRRRYRSPSQLVREAIDVPMSIRFLHLAAFMDFLLELWKSEDKEVSAKAERTLERLATFDLNLFYGQDGIGAQPQMEIVDYLAKRGDDTLLSEATVVMKMLNQVLSPSMDGHRWTYNAVNIVRGSLVADGGVADMRSKAITLLKRMFVLSDDVLYRKSVLSTLSTAARRERPVSDAGTSAMFDRDAIEVLNFMRDRVSSDDLQLVQAIEHTAYWSYYHAASPQIADAALQVRDAIAERAEYSIYKMLIGFEGIHGDWVALNRSDSAWDFSDETRREAAKQYVAEINQQTFAAWRDRILEFSKTRSDDMAMFPIFYDFLKDVGRTCPQLALELLTHEERMQPFLIALVRGLWLSDRTAEAEALTARWLGDREKLRIVAKSLNADENARLDLLTRVMDEAEKVDDSQGAEAVIEAMGVAAHQFGLGHVQAKAIFLKGMRLAARRNDARWARVVWFNRDFRKLVDAMSQEERGEVLLSLRTIAKIDYQAEEILAAIGAKEPQALLQYLMARVRRELDPQSRADDTHSDDGNRFEAIPYSLHALDKLFTSTPDMLLQAVRSEFRLENASLFSFLGGTRLIKATFPEFGQPLQDELLRLIRTGRPGDVEFVTACLRAYEGSVHIHGVCKEIIKSVPEQSGIWNDVAAAIESTGVVSGEYGMVQAYEAKRDQIAVWKSDENPRVRAFAAWLTENLERMIAAERQRAEEGLALRKHRYGVSGSAE